MPAASRQFSVPRKTALIRARRATPLKNPRRKGTERKLYALSISFYEPRAGEVCPCQISSMLTTNLPERGSFVITQVRSSRASFGV